MLNSPVGNPVTPPSKNNARSLYPIFNFKQNAAALRAKFDDTKDSLYHKISPRLSGGKVVKKRRKRATMRKVRRKLPFMNAEQQYAIDAGQKDFDAQRCKTCNMLYLKGEEQDENHHRKYHDLFVNSVKFSGWKNQRVVQYLDDGARILLIRPDDPKYMLKKMDDLFSIADQELGINSSIFENLQMDSIYLVYLTSNNRIAGFVAGEPVTHGFEFIAEEGLALTTEKISVELGISRLWVHNSYRRQGIASQLVDTIRSAVYSDKIVAKDKVAFSDPSSPGVAFGTKYTGRKNILVYGISVSLEGEEIVATDDSVDDKIDKTKVQID
ncbi:establishment of cohesion [Brevipalpus obovatus]|uniref:establishment of cohesion n=1 Tax=Brevipalpus obovatus TaxID=246614 RepID=UPI003D9EC1B3